MIFCGTLFCNTVDYINRKILVSDYKIVASLIDKGKMFDFLEKNKINVGKWSNINSFMDLKNLMTAQLPIKKSVKRKIK